MQVSRELWDVAVALISPHGSAAAGIARDRALRAVQEDHQPEFQAGHAVATTLELLLRAEPASGERVQ
jgi:hypothetical protein